MNVKVEADISLVTINCGECGGTYAINSRYYKQRQDYGGYWHCPYCQTSWGFGETEFDKLKKQLQKEEMRTRTLRFELEQSEQDLKHQTHLTRAEKAAKTRIKNRVHKGVCPHCNRHFQNLQRHMETKHKDQLTAKECEHD